MLVEGGYALHNPIRGNAIAANGSLSIDLGADGVTANDPGDADNGPHGFQNYPQLTTAAQTASGVQVHGQLFSLPNATYLLDFYASAGESPAVAVRFLGSIMVSTDASGMAAFDTLAAVAAGEYLNAVIGRAEGEAGPRWAAVPASDETGGGTAWVPGADSRPKPADQGSQAVRLESVSLNGGGIAAIGDVAVHKAAYLGDADGSGIHSAADAFLVVQAALGLASGFAAHAWTDPRIVGDADGSGVLSAADAFLIVQERLGLSEPFVPDNPGVPVTPLGGGVDPQFRIDTAIPAVTGGVVTVPVRLDVEAAATNVGAIDFVLDFDPAVLTIDVSEGVIPGADTAAGWGLSAALVEAGQLQVGLVGVGSEPLTVGLREIAQLQFHVAASPRDAETAESGLGEAGLPGAADGVALDIEPVDPRAGGYAWTAVDGSVAIRAAGVWRKVAEPLGVRGGNGAVPLDQLIRDLLEEDLSLNDTLSEIAADVAIARL